MQTCWKFLPRERCVEMMLFTINQIEYGARARNILILIRYSLIG